MNNYNLLAGRYEIIKLIGEGGMADVYLAKDTILEREVAIKILRGYLAEDPVYVQRFKREASAAATLSHPNIVEIYDVGEEDGKYYIVMEYVPGITLKELIHKRGAIHTNEAVDIMKQLVAATKVAHQFGIIHRDIKPANVIVTNIGTVKVADFGIATIQSVSQITQTDSILGSLHYLAPELARGEKATVQSDIYALGIVLFEMLRGDVPFNGESAVNIALKHMREEIPAIKDFNPTIPQSLENIITRSTVKNLNYRYESCEEMLNDLNNCLNDNMKGVEKLVLDESPEDEPTMVFSAGTSIDKEFNWGDDDMTKRKGNKAKKINKKQKPKLNALSVLLYSITGIGSVAVILLMLFLTVGSNWFKPKPITIPDLTGMTREEAIEKLEEVGLTLDDSYVNKVVSADIDEDLIVYSSPAKGKEVVKGTSVKITVSKGPYIIIDDYIGMEYTKVEKELSNMGINVIKVEVPHGEIEKGIIIDQNLNKGFEFDPSAQNKQIKLTVSSGFEVTVPGVVGWSITDAKTTLEALGIVVNLEKIDWPSDPAGITADRVVTQSIEKDTIIKDASRAIDLTYYALEDRP